MTFICGANTIGSATREERKSGGRRPFDFSGRCAQALTHEQLDPFRDKTLSLACEIAHVLGLDAERKRALAVVEPSLTTTQGLPAQAHETWSAKYATGRA